MKLQLHRDIASFSLGWSEAQAVRSGFVALAKLCADKNPAIVEMQS